MKNPEDITKEDMIKDYQEMMDNCKGLPKAELEALDEFYRFMEEHGWVWQKER